MNRHGFYIGKSDLQQILPSYDFTHPRLVKLQEMSALKNNLINAP